MIWAVHPFPKTLPGRAYPLVAVAFSGASFIALLKPGALPNAIGETLMKLTATLRIPQHVDKEKVIVPALPGTVDHWSDQHPSSHFVGGHTVVHSIGGCCAEGGSASNPALGRAEHMQEAIGFLRG